ncbi:hypothetical protein GASC598I20_002040 [Gilliamella apicola SCGC AB-598-I20]|nr:hypothetical protein GASC598I20_002040 [Gilliamella apicola SCGC AB-598-I20]
MFFDEGSDDFFVDLDGAREANRFTRQSFNTGTERQVIALYALREDLASQMFLLRHLSCIAAPVVTGNHADVERRQQSQQFTAGLIGSGAKSVGQNTARFGIVSVPEPVL